MRNAEAEFPNPWVPRLSGKLELFSLLTQLSPYYLRLVYIAPPNNVHDIVS